MGRGRPRQIILGQHGGCHRYLKPLGTRRQISQIKINRRLRDDWAALDDSDLLPFGPYPKRPDHLRRAAA